MLTLLPNSYAAKLVMDSRRMLQNLRTQRSLESWSQLYKAGDHVYLDLRLTSSQRESTLFGQLIADPSLYIPVHSTIELSLDRETKYQGNVSPTGSFRIPVVENGVYRLEVNLQSHLITVDQLQL